MNINMSEIELELVNGWICIKEIIDGQEKYSRLLYDDGSQTREQHEQRLRLQGSWNFADYKDDLYTVFDFGITGIYWVFKL